MLHIGNTAHNAGEPEGKDTTEQALGEFEQSCGVPIVDEIERRNGPVRDAGGVHVTLRRLGVKGLISSGLDPMLKDAT